MKLKCLINLTFVIIKWHKSIMWMCGYFFEWIVFLLKNKNYKVKIGIKGKKLYISYNLKCYLK
jgi:hypothetical protein